MKTLKKPGTQRVLCKDKNAASQPRVLDARETLGWRTETQAKCLLFIPLMPLEK